MKTIEAKQDPVLDRVIKPSLNKELAEQLKIIYEYIRKEGAWNIQFRPNNEIFMYYKGNALILKIYRNGQCFSISPTNKILKEKAKAKKISSIDGSISKPISKMAELLINEKWLDAMALAIDEHNSIDKEKSIEQQIATRLEHNQDFFIIDIEIRVSRQGYKSDMLGMKKCQNNTYRFVPIELKLSYDEGSSRPRKNGQPRNPVGQACEFCKIIKDNQAVFIKHYERIFKDKKRFGLFSGIDEMRIATDVSHPVVLVIGEPESEIYKTRLEKAAQAKDWNYSGMQGCSGCPDDKVCRVTVRYATLNDFLNNPMEI